MLLFLIEFGWIVQVADDTVDASTYKPLRLEVVEQVQMLALTALNHRCQQHHFAAFVQCQDLIDHLADFLGLERQVVIGAAWLAGAGEQQPQVVVDLGDGADGRARVVRGRFLLDRDRRGQPFDMINVGFFHH